MFADCHLAAAFLHGAMWTAPLKTVGFVGGTLVLARTWMRAAAPLLAVFLVVCGLEHFAYTDLVATLIPSWIPLHTFWTYFAGVALIAGGTGMLVPPTARVAATLSALMIALWIPLVHIPLAITSARHAFEAAGAFEPLGMSGVALLVVAAHGHQCHRLLRRA
jgi:uncharacterized membrane protein